MILNHWIIGSVFLKFFCFKSFCSLLNFVTLGFASSIAFCCHVITIFYAFDVTSVRSHSCIYLWSLNARIRRSSFHLHCFLTSWTPLWGVRHKRLTVTNGRCYSILPLEATTGILLPSHFSTILAMPRIQLQSPNAIIKVNKIPPWLFSVKSNTPLRRSFLSHSVPCWILSHWDLLLLLHFVVIWLPSFMRLM